MPDMICAFWSTLGYNLMPNYAINPYYDYRYDYSNSIFLFGQVYYWNNKIFVKARPPRLNITWWMYGLIMCTLEVLTLKN